MTIKSIDLSTCSRCGVCYLVCPNDVIRSKDNTEPVILFKEDCTACALCAERCPFGCITVIPGAAKKFNEVFTMKYYLKGLGIITK